MNLRDTHHLGQILAHLGLPATEITRILQPSAAHPVPDRPAHTRGEIHMYPSLFTTPGLKRFAEDLDTERQAQLRKWGDQRHADGTGAEHYVAMADEAREGVEQFVAQHSGPEWALILLEEVYEALAESDPAKLRTELIQANAVIAAWISDLDRRPHPMLCAHGLWAAVRINQTKEK